MVGRGANARIVGRLETGDVFGEMCLIEPGPRSATVTAACDTECLAVSYQDFIAGIEEKPERAVGFMKTLVRRLRKMNELLESASPEGRGFRAMLLDCQPSGGSPEAGALSWTMLW
jgi:CRP-like cAMP-binding protein